MARASRNLSPAARATLAAAGLLMSVEVAGVAPATAQGAYPGARHGHGGVVTAESRFGNGAISAPVRPGPRGFEVRLPRGTWIPCERSCSDTLRRQTVDFWESHGPQAKDAGRGYLQWHWRY